MYYGAESDPVKCRNIKEKYFNLNSLFKPEDLTIHGIVVYPFSLSDMLNEKGLQVNAPMLLLYCISLCIFCLSSQKRSLPRLLQVAKEHNQHLPRPLLSAQPDDAVLHRDLHRQGLSESEIPDPVISTRLTALWRSCSSPLSGELALRLGETSPLPGDHVRERRAV